MDEACLEGILKRSNGLLNGTRIHVTAKMLPVLQSQFIYLHDWRLLQTSEELPGGGRLSYFAFNPAREEIGFRLDWPSHSLAYVTDTIASPEATYVDKIAGVDLLLHDCNLPDSKSMLANSINHSYTSAVAQVAARAHVKHLILIHPNPVGWPIEPDLPTARNIFPATEIGRDGMEVEF